MTHTINPKCGIDFALNVGSNIPAIGFDTWKIPKEKTKETIKTAIESGYRHFDCALAYGNQQEIGEAFHDALLEGKISRGELFVTSKLWNTHHKRHSAYDDLETTLRQLQLHHVDLWLMHWPFAFHAAPKHGSDMEAAKDQNGKIMLDDTTILETWKAMETMHKDGKACAIGVSNFTLPQMEQLLAMCEIRPAVLQIELHPYLQQVELVEYCQSKGILVTAYNPLGSQLSGDGDVLSDPVLMEIGKAHNKTPGQVVLQYQVQHHIAVIPMATHMQEYLHIFDFQLTAEEIKKIEGLDKGMRFISPEKIWGFPLFPEESGNVEIAQAVGEMFAHVEAS